MRWEEKQRGKRERERNRIYPLKEKKENDDDDDEICLEVVSRIESDTLPTDHHPRRRRGLSHWKIQFELEHTFSIPSRVFIEEQRGGDDYPKTPDKPNLKKWWSFLLNYGNVAPSRTIRYALVSSECTCERNRGNLHWRARRERERMCVCKKACLLRDRWWQPRNGVDLEERKRGDIEC